MHRFRASLVAIAPLLVLPPLAPAQEGPSMPPGRTAPVPLQSRVRVTTEAQPASPYVGRFRAWDGSAFVLERPDRSRLTVELSDVARLELSEGQRGHALTGGLIGLGAGVVFTGLMVAADDWQEPGYSMLFGSLIFGGAGAGLGALIGSQVKREDWQEIPLDLYRPGGPTAAVRHP